MDFAIATAGDKSYTWNVINATTLNYNAHSANTHSINYERNKTYADV